MEDIYFVTNNVIADITILFLLVSLESHLHGIAPTGGRGMFF
jgi:hypothetical protein